MGEMGELIGIYRARVVPFVALAVSGGAIILVGLLVLAMLYAASTGSIDYSGSVPKLLAFGLALIAIGAGLIYLSIVWKPKYYYEAYENGVIVKKKSGDITLLFQEIEDILPFVNGVNHELRYNHLAFRKDANSEWFLISPRFTDHYNFIEGFCERHTELRGEKLLSEIKKVGFAPFKYIAKSALNKIAFSAKAFIDELGEYIAKYSQYKTLYLAADHIKMDEKIIYFDENDLLEVSGLVSDTIYIKDASGREKFSVPYKALITADIFIAIVSTKTQFKEG